MICMKENSFLLQLFSLQLHINTTKHKGPGYHHIYYTADTSTRQAQIFTVSRLDNPDSNTGFIFMEKILKKIFFAFFQNIPFIHRMTLVHTDRHTNIYIYIYI